VREGPSPTAAGALVDVDSALAAAGVSPLVEELERDLVGLAPVKARVREIAAFLLVTKLREAHGVSTVSSERPSLHMSFTGSPGTGKTTVALRMARILHGLGYLRKGHLVVAGRDELVGTFVGQTAPKTKEVVRKALGGVLLVDEAYALYRPENERDYGIEAVETLLTAMESHRDDLVVILAGYGERMARFFQSNPGLRSRVAHHVDFPDYDLPELLTIAERMAAAQGYRFDERSLAAFREYLERRRAQPHFGNARSVRNALDRIRLRQASRLVQSGGVVPVGELSRIDASDVRRSRVFLDAAAPADPAPERRPS
jgi:probable Rubsico expression protein CbbX